MAKRSPASKDVIVEAIGRGATYKLACQAAGISKETFYAWQRVDVDFSDRIKKAEAARALRWLERIDQAGAQQSWQANAWLLERTHPDEYAKPAERHEISGPGGQAVTFRWLSPDEGQGQLRVMADQQVLEGTLLRLTEGADTDDTDPSDPHDPLGDRA